MTLDTLHLVFSAFGTVQKIATFEKQSGFQALVQYPDAQTAEQVGLPSDHMPVCKQVDHYDISCVRARTTRHSVHAASPRC